MSFGNSIRSLLALIKQEVRFKNVPAIVLTTSEVGVDVRQVHGRGANCFATNANSLRSN